jgi:hypothetical protein
VSEGKKDDGRKAEESRLAKVKGIRFVNSGSSGVEIATVGPRQAEALRRQHEKKQAEREAAGGDTGGHEPGEETNTNV